MGTSRRRQGREDGPGWRLEEGEELKEGEKGGWKSEEGKCGKKRYKKGERTWLGTEGGGEDGENRSDGRKEGVREKG